MSLRAPLHFCSTVTRWPIVRRMRAHRAAVLRLPLRICAAAGVMMQILNDEPCGLHYRRATITNEHRMLASTIDPSLQQMVLDARSSTLGLAATFTSAQLLGPRLSI